ncbi:hypothetical protein CGRA01v4_02113 [Colletotrichum graminicola]|nr:hypothetical protein CGRA01v4_02113 [Colletotrichum graminicola]
MHLFCRESQSLTAVVMAAASEILSVAVQMRLQGDQKIFLHRTQTRQHRDPSRILEYDHRAAPCCRHGIQVGKPVVKVEFQIISDPRRWRLLEGSYFELPCLWLPCLTGKYPKYSSSTSCCCWYIYWYCW